MPMRLYMSLIGGPNPLAGAVAGTQGAHDAAGKTQAKRDREKSERTRRTEDAIELTVAGLETLEAPRPADGEEKSQSERRPPPRQERPRVVPQEAAAGDGAKPPPRPRVDVLG